jgi:hypothetical protein
MENNEVKLRFSLILQPFLDLLEYQREYVSFNDWIYLVNRDHARIISQPEQYLGGELPPVAIIKKVVDEIFKDFIAHELESLKEHVSIL